MDEDQTEKQDSQRYALANHSHSQSKSKQVKAKKAVAKGQFVESKQMVFSD